MSDTELPAPYEELPPENRGFRFTTWGLLVLLTVVSLALAVVLGLSRAFGIPVGEIFQSSFVQFLAYLPMLTIWIVGLVMAARRRKQERRRATLAMWAFGLLIVNSTGMQLTQMVLIYYVTQIASIGFWFTTLGLISMTVNCICWILIIKALFGRDSQKWQRPPVPSANPPRPQSPWDNDN